MVQLVESRIGKGNGQSLKLTTVGIPGMTYWCYGSIRTMAWVKI